MSKEKSFPTQCIGCGKCESHCPQGIHIIQELKNANSYFITLQRPLLFLLLFFCLKMSLSQLYGIYTYRPVPSF
ncbi:MAG: 4Fe-4S binding protein [Eubacterium sp.]|nr:4Fe-4S binding protein [Eubacterium sp.]